MTQFSEATLALPGGHFHVLRGGESSERPLVIVLHGFPDHPPTFLPMMRLLADSGWAVAAPWMRGYAPSVRSGPYHLQRLATDVLELADALSPGRPVCLVGHDWGALTTYQVAAMAPHRIAAAVTMAVPHPLAVLRSMPRTAQLLRSWYILLFQLPVAERAGAAGGFALIDLLWRRWSPDFTLPDEEREALHRTFAISWPAPLGHYRAMMKPFGDAVTASAARSAMARPIEVPTLHLHGDRDGCMSPRTRRGQERYFQGPFASELVPDAGHFLQLEAPGAMASRVASWLGTHA